MSDENANEPNSTPWFARQVGEERGTDYSRVSFPAWLRNAPTQPSDDQAGGAEAPVADVADAAPQNDAPAAAPEITAPAGESAEEPQAPTAEEAAALGEDAAEVGAPESVDVAADFEAAHPEEAAAEEVLEAEPEAELAEAFLPEAEAPVQEVAPVEETPSEVAPEASDESAAGAEGVAAEAGGAEDLGVDPAVEATVVEEAPAVSLPAWAAMDPEASAPEPEEALAEETPAEEALAEEASVEVAAEPAPAAPVWAALDAPQEPEAVEVADVEPAPAAADLAPVEEPAAETVAEPVVEAAAEEPAWSEPAAVEPAEAEALAVAEVPAAPSPVPSRRSLRQGTWLDALEEENREAQAAEEAARAALELEEAKAAELAAQELATQEQAAQEQAATEDLADIAPLTPTEYDSAANAEDAAPAAELADLPEASAEEVDTTAVRRYSLLAAVGATAAASRLEEQETFPAEPAGRAAPAEQVLGLKERAVEEVPAVEAAEPAGELDWRDAIHTGRHEAVEAPAEESLPSWNPLSEEDVAHSPVAPQEAAKPAEDSVLEGASFQPTPLSRASAHWWSLLFTLLLVPVAWFLVTDAAAQLSSAQGISADSPLRLSAPPVWPITELILGAIAGSLAVFVARWSSVGACVVGTLFSVAGGLLTFVPNQVNMWVGALFTDLLGYNTSTQRFVLAFLGDGVSGRILLGGLFLIFVGVVSHGARRQGRREQANHDVLGQRKAKRRRAKH
ncbi:MAG: hypothetical protein Q3999_07305 [Buchananella hordeovulneris]|nr:hypothetical protein [Buchananella hordeovulneris]